MSYQFYIIPGGDGINDYGWFNWLRGVLEAQGNAATICDEQILSPATRAELFLDKYPVDEKTIIIGHSFGALAAMKWAELIASSICGLILLDPSVKDTFEEPYSGGLTESDRRQYLESWAWKFDLSKAKSHIQKCIILSDEQLVGKRRNWEAVHQEYVAQLGATYLSVKGEKEHFCNHREAAVLDAILALFESIGDVSIETNIDYLAKIIWDYMLMHHELKPMDAIFALGSNETKVAERAADLYLQGYGKYVICAGGNGKASNFSLPEAEIFGDIVVSKGVPRDRVILEPNSTNTGENVQFVKKLVNERGLDLRSFLLVQKQYMERRTYATFRKQWPEAECLVTSPQGSFEEDMKDPTFKHRNINVMVGDLLRIKQYPGLGFQIEQEISESAWDAGQKLLGLGFDRYTLM